MDVKRHNAQGAQHIPGVAQGEAEHGVSCLSVGPVRQQVVGVELVRRELESNGGQGGQGVADVAEGVAEHV